MDGEAADPVAWLRTAITGRLELAKAAGGSRPQWSARYGVIVTDENDRDWGVLDLSPCIEDRSIGEHVAANDPQDTIARCEMELAILDEHYILTCGDRNEAYEEFSVVKIGGADKDSGCVTCHYYGQGGVKGYGICRTVRLLLGAYRFRSGYDEKWGATPD